MRLLIVHPGGIGDVVLAVPAMRTLRWRHGAVEVALLAAQEVGKLLENCNEVDTVFPLESGALAELLAGDGLGTSPFLNWMKKCRFAQCWMEDKDGTLGAAFALHGTQKVIIASPMSGRLKARHQTDRFLEAAECPDSLPEADRPLRMKEGMEGRGRAAIVESGVPGNRPYVVIHPGSGSVHKCCDAAVLTSVVNWVSNKDLIPLIIEGPADEQQVKNLLMQQLRSFYLVKENDLSTLAAIIKNAVLYVGCDSGITHLAAAFAVPTIVCFGPTDENRWCPRGKFVANVRGTSCFCPTWEAVQQCGEKPCLKISSSLLLQACEQMVASSQAKA